MTSVKSTILFVVALVAAHASFAQEGLREMQHNSAQLYHRHKPVPQHMQTRATLPFVDDFSTSHVKPDASKWIGAQVYINATCPVNPPSIGVATFDGLDSTGLPYNTTGSSTTPQSADTLTSVPIDLSSYNFDDSIYLSFLWEPQGICDYPNLGDSLVLEFKAGSSEWIRKWGVDGFNSAPQDVRFTSKLIRLDSAIYFSSSFQFRFRSKAAVIGNNDHWHIDYVQLDENRNSGDSTLNDIAIQYPSPSLLKTYYEMPWKQFRANAANETATTAKIFTRNNYTTDKNTSFGYNSTELFSSTALANPPLASFNFGALSNATLDLTAVDMNGLVVNDSALIETNYFTFLSGSPDELPANDTITQQQRFSNYFAYDDGSAEKAYFLNGTAAQGALRFHMNVEDSLQGVMVHWSRINGPQNDLLFSVVVWKSLVNNQVLFQRDFLHPVDIDSINGYTTYLFDSAVLATDTFYIGWLQSQTEGMDIGFDKNTDAHNNFWFNLGQQWQQSSQLGSLMIRPIVGRREGIFNTHVNQSEAIANRWNAYPNPVNDWVKIGGAPSDSRYQLIDALGRTFASGVIHNERVDLPALPSGFYMLHVSSTNAFKTFRIVKQ